MRSTRVNGKPASKKVKASGKVYLGTLILASGHKVKLMVMGYISGRTAIDTKVNGSFV